MRLLITLLCLAPLFAQQPPPPGGARPARPAPKNLKLLDPANLMSEMHFYESALGVKCTHCHVQGNFASDDKPEKETARRMIVMARDINAKYFGAESMTHSGAASAHEGAPHDGAAHDGAAHDGAAHDSAKMHVTCYTCHHGSVEPMTAPAKAAPSAAPASHSPAEK